jgi:hypothetical protein
MLKYVVHIVTTGIYTVNYKIDLWFISTAERVSVSTASTSWMTGESEPTFRPIMPLIKWIPGTLSPERKGLRGAGDHSPPSSVEVTNLWSYTSTPLYVFMVWCFVKYRVKKVKLSL